jgi:glycosyltransferase involved in cell wall biosynthesis
MDCLLITSLTEAGPLPLFEALATGVPVAATPVGWAPHFAALAPEFVRLGRSPAELAAHIIGFHSRRQELFARRHQIAALAATPRLDFWFREVLTMATRVAGLPRTCSRRSSSRPTMP